MGGNGSKMLGMDWCNSVYVHICVHMYSEDDAPIRNTCEIESGSNLGMRLHISIFHSVGSFVDAIWKIESDFQLPFNNY